MTEKDQEFAKVVIEGLKKVNTQMRTIEGKNTELDMKYTRFQSAIDRVSKDSESNYDELSKNVEKLNDKVIEIDKSLVEVKTEIRNIKDTIRDTIREVFDIAGERPSTVARLTQVELDMMKNKVQTSSKKDEDSEKSDGDQKGKWAAIATISTTIGAIITMLITHLLK